MTQEVKTILKEKEEVLKEIARIAETEEQKGTARRYMLRVKRLLDSTRELEKEVFRGKEFES